jgi:tetratricopeptide (TPR) repeat protein
LYNISGAVYKGLGKFDASIEAYNKALAIKPNNVEAYYNMGNALKGQGELEESIVAYSKALVIKPGYADAYNNMGNALQEQGKLEEAIEAFNKALAIKPDCAEPYCNIGNALQEHGKLEEAIAAYNKAITIKPDYAEAIENSLSLAVQLLPIIANYGYDFNNSETQVNSEVVLRPKYQVQNLIKTFLEANFSKAHSYNKNFKACDRKLLGKLKPKDKVFCNAYSIFIGKLLETRWDNAQDSGTENKVYHLGESHCLSYAHRNITIGSSNFRIAPRITFGAKAFHFSRTKHDSFKAITKAHFVSLPKSSKVFLSYGEIDCRPNEGFISAASKLNKPLEELIDHTTSGYVQWFLEQNAGQRHHLYFINVPAPVYDENLTTDLNSEVARTVALFNAALKKYSLQHGFDTVDVFKFTVGKEGFSNGLFHIDNRHLGAKALVEIKRQLS